MIEYTHKIICFQRSHVHFVIHPGIHCVGGVKEFYVLLF